MLSNCKKIICGAHFVRQNHISNTIRLSVSPLQARKFWSLAASIVIFKVFFRAEGAKIFGAVFFAARGGAGGGRG